MRARSTFLCYFQAGNSGRQLADNLVSRQSVLTHVIAEVILARMGANALACLPRRCRASSRSFRARPFMRSRSHGTCVLAGSRVGATGVDSATKRRVQRVQSAGMATPNDRVRHSGDGVSLAPRMCVCVCVGEWGWHSNRGELGVLEWYRGWFIFAMI